MKKKRTLIDWANEQQTNLAEIGDAAEVLENFHHLIVRASSRGELLQLRSSLFRSEQAHRIVGDPLDSQQYMNLLSEITSKIASLSHREVTP